jgi:hypothetical protein
MSIYYASGYTLSRPQLLTANYTYIYTASDEASMCTISIHAFDSFPYLNVTRKISVSINPFRSYTTTEKTDELGNRVLRIIFPCVPRQEYAVTLLEYMMNFEIQFKIDPNNIGEFDRTSLWYKRYTAPAQYIESDNPEIIAASKRIVGNETNPYLQARRIFDFVQNIRFDYSLARWNSTTEGALYILRSGRGVCRHHAALFVALCRAAGIPAAEILGIFGENAPINHGWVHFYLRNYGWVPAEPTTGACNTHDGSTCFGGLGDIQHTPLMSVNYQYWTADCRSCSKLLDVFANDTANGPIVSNGFPNDIVSLNDQTIQSMIATVAMDKANASIRAASTEGRTVGIEKAELLLSNASEAFARLDYDSAIAFSKEAKEAADLAARPQISSTLSSTSNTSSTMTQETVSGSSNNYLYAIGGAALVLAVVVGSLVVRSRKRANNPHR